MAIKAECDRCGVLMPMGVSNEYPRNWVTIDIVPNNHTDRKRLNVCGPCGNVIVKAATRVFPTRDTPQA